MAGKLRIQYLGAIYHVMNRGDRREAIFEDDEDRQRLLETLTEACENLNVVGGERVSPGKRQTRLAGR
jgi:putative transposase